MKFPCNGSQDTCNEEHVRIEPSNDKTRKAKLTLPNIDNVFGKNIQTMGKIKPYKINYKVDAKVQQILENK